MSDETHYPPGVQIIRRWQERAQQLRQAQNLTNAQVDELEKSHEIIQKELQIDLSFLTANPKQLRVADGFWSGTRRLLASVGANRSGKSWAAGRLCCARWIRDRGYPGARIWCISQNFEKSVEGPQRELWEALEKERFSREWSPELGFGDRSVVLYYTGEGKRDLQKYITIKFLNEEQKMNVFETVAVDGVWWDEAKKESLLGRLIMRCGDRSGWILISTLPEEMWLQTRIEESQKENWELIKYTTFDNQHNLPPGEIQEMMSGLTPEEVSMRIYGEFVLLTGLCFREFRPTLRPDGHVLEDPPELPEDWPCWLYIDTGNHTCCLLVTVNPDNEKIIWDEVYEHGLRVDALLHKIKDMLQAHRRNIHQVSGVFMDPAAWVKTPSNEVTLGDEYYEIGKTIFKATFPASKWLRTKEIGEKAMINAVRMAFDRNELFITERCRNTIRECRTWRWKLDEQQRLDLREKPMDSDNHACDCIKAFVADLPVFQAVDVGLYDTDPEIIANQEESWQEQLV